MDGLVSQMERLSKATDDRHRSKKERSALRATFRGLCVGKPGSGLRA